MGGNKFLELFTNVNNEELTEILAPFNVVEYLININVFHCSPLHCCSANLQKPLRVHIFEEWKYAFSQRISGGSTPCPGAILNALCTNTSWNRNKGSGKLSSVLTFSWSILQEGGGARPSWQYGFRQYDRHGFIGNCNEICLCTQCLLWTQGRVISSWVGL